MDDAEWDIEAQRRKIVGEEKRIKEEMKRQKEMQKRMAATIGAEKAKANADLTNLNVTFDYEGKILEIKYPNELEFPDTLTNPKVKFKKAVVESNLLKEVLEKFPQQKKKKEKTEDGGSSVD